jgi:hypothetical protein
MKINTLNGALPESRKGGFPSVEPARNADKAQGVPLFISFDENARAYAALFAGFWNGDAENVGDDIFAHG